MLPYHSHFRSALNSINQTLALPHVQSLPSKDLKSLLGVSIDLTHHLEGHHSIEEKYIFPLLAKRLPQFGKVHLQEHAQMHKELEKFGKFCQDCLTKLNDKRGKNAKAEGCGKPLEEDGSKLKEWSTEIWDSEKMKTLAKVLSDSLLHHLKEEEASLHPDSIQGAGFTLQELSRIPM